jgi:D-alanyl-D-alanine dipeptidase
VAPTIQQDMRYFGRHNFIGRPIAGYLAPECILTAEAARRLMA